MIRALRRNVGEIRLNGDATTAISEATWPETVRVTSTVEA